MHELELICKLEIFFKFSISREVHKEISLPNAVEVRVKHLESRVKNLESGVKHLWSIVSNTWSA